MADLVNETPRPLTQPKPDPAVSRRRFGAAYLVLAVIVGAAVGLIVVLATRNDVQSSNAPSASSEVAVKDDGTTATRQIARAISARYRLPDGRRQFVAVTANAMEIPTQQGPVPISALVVSSGLAGVSQESIKVVYPKTGVFYQMAGGATDNLPRAPSEGEEPLLARESVDLALTTFKRLPGSDQVFIVLPPLRGSTQADPRYARALYFDRASLSDSLRSPVSATVKQLPVVTADNLTADEANTFTELTSDRMYHYSVQQLANNSLALFLTPPALS